MADAEDLISEAVVSTAERWEEAETMEEVEDWLEVKVLSDLYGRVDEVRVVETVGGPYIEVNVSRGTVFGSWGGETHETHFNNAELAHEVEEYLITVFEEAR